jgi:hypothetical protein
MDRNSPPAHTRPLDELEAEITELAGHLNAAQHRWLTLIAEFDRRQGWSDGACLSCAHWLNFKCGIDLGAAREKVRVAHALESLPRISAAMSRGEVSYSKVRAITRAAGPETEEYFLSIALHGTAHHVERLVRHFRRAQEAEELSREARQQAGRSLHYHFDDDGSLIVKARLPAEAGALLIKGLEAGVDAISAPDVSAEMPARVGGDSEGDRAGAACDEPPSRAARRADALAVLAESFLKHGAETLSGGERHQIVVHIDAETLRDSTAGRCEIEHGPALPAETVRRLGCDCSVVMLLENDSGEALSVGRKTRSIPPALRRALNSRDQGCRFPGCTHTRYVDAHHVKHWAHGGETKASNLVSLCSFHHRLVHEGGIQVEVLDDGAFRFIRPDGRAFDSVAPAHTPTFDWQALAEHNYANDICVTRETAVTRWRGERMDYSLATEVLLAQANRSREGVSAATWR